MYQLIRKSDGGIDLEIDGEHIATVAESREEVQLLKEAAEEFLSE